MVARRPSKTLSREKKGPRRARAKMKHVAMRQFLMCVAQIFLDSHSDQSGNSHRGTGVSRVLPVSFKSVIRSNLPSFLLPCPHCGHRMAITAVTPARSGGSAESTNLEDITHGC